MNWRFTRGYTVERSLMIVRNVTKVSCNLVAWRLKKMHSGEKPYSCQQCDTLHYVSFACVLSGYKIGWNSCYIADIHKASLHCVSSSELPTKHLPKGNHPFKLLYYGTEKSILFMQNWITFTPFFNEYHTCIMRGRDIIQYCHCQREGGKMVKLKLVWG